MSDRSTATERPDKTTEVLGWWLQGLDRQARWWPVMGPLHEDSEAFRFHLWHYHVDPQRLSPCEHRRYVRPHRKQEVWNLYEPREWHPAYTAVMAQFWTEEGSLTIGPQGGTVMRRQPNEVVRLLSSKAATELIRTRQADRPIRRRAETPELLEGPSWIKPFRELRERYPNAVGDVCPHRGYDLRGVPVGSDGCRQCPLHQLRVRVPDKTARPASAYPH